MRLIIPYRHDPSNGFELRYAIRSMVKHFKGMSGVVLIGDKPDWYCGGHIPAADTGAKEWNIVKKILLSPYEDFLYSNDDFFAAQDFDETLPNYYSTELRTARVHGKYVGRVINCRSVYPDGLFYDIHTPMVINLTKYREANNLPQTKEYLCKSLYGNFIGGGVQLQDNKIRNGKLIPPGPFFSTNDRTCKMINLNELYPVKSDYEMDINTSVTNGLC